MEKYKFLHDNIFQIQYDYRSQGFGNIHICFMLQGSLEPSDEEPDGKTEQESGNSGYLNST
jgi:hypothetical protein